MSKDPKASSIIPKTTVDEISKKEPENLDPPTTVLKVIAPHIKTKELPTLVSAAAAANVEKNIKEKSLENAKPPEKATISTKLKEKLIARVGADKKDDIKEQTGKLYLLSNSEII